MSNIYMVLYAFMQYVTNGMDKRNVHLRGIHVHVILEYFKCLYYNYKRQ